MLRLILLAFAIAVAATLVSYTSSSYVQAQQRNLQMLPEKALTHKKLGKWGYEASQLDKVMYLRILSDVNDKSSLQTLLTEQRASANAVFASAEVVPAVVLLKEAISPDNLAGFASQYNLSIQSYTLLAQNSKGEYITFFGAPVDGNIFPRHILQTMIKNIEEAQATTLTLKGVVSIDVKMNAEAFKQLGQANSILGVDLTPALALRDLKSTSKELRQIVQDAESAHSLHITSAPFYWISGR